jgi:hypothetical protein
MRRERIDRRVLGALRFLDAATRAQVGGPLRVEAEGVGLVRNASGLYVVVRAPGFEEYTAAFDAPPAGVASRDVVFTVRDPARRYLARRVTVRFPRAPQPANAGDVAPLFRPVDVPLYHAPAAAVAPGWAVLRVRVRDQADNPLAGALLLVVPDPNPAGGVLARGLSDSRGEALVAVPGIPVTNWGADDEEVTTPTVKVKVRAVFDPPAGPNQTAPPPPDPDDIEARAGALKSGEVTAELRSGGAVARTIPIALN